MSAKIFHFCQACKQLVSPSINDDKLKEYDQVADYNKYVDSRLTRWIVSCCCPKCNAPWKRKLLYIGPPRRHRVASLRFGKGNYKKRQQAKAKWNSTTPSYGVRMNRIGLGRK